jgi:hypothetical protein
MPSEAYAPAIPGARQALAATIVPMRRNASTVVVLAGPAPGEVLAAVGRSINADFRAALPAFGARINLAWADGLSVG